MRVSLLGSRHPPQASPGEQAYPYGYSFAGLLDCYSAGIPFYRGTLVGDVIYSATFFGLHAVLSRAYFPEERVAVVEEIRDEEMR